MKSKCSNCKHFQRFDVPGDPYGHTRRCTRPDAVTMQLDSGGNPMDKNSMPCFEPKQIPLWRLPVAIVAAVFWSVAIAVGIYFTLGVTLASGGDFRPVPILVPIIVAVISFAFGVFMAIKWYQGEL